MILNMVGGGGAGLNFSVKAYASESALPSVEKENTIAVITETEITSWIFSATEPESMEEGMVWISTGTSSPVEFNALRKNGIQVYPLSAKQYVGGAFVKKETQIYQVGEWNYFWDGMLYDNGDQITGITGGWKFARYSDDKCAFNADHIYIDGYTSASSREASAYTENKINTRGYTTLVVKVAIVKYGSYGFYCGLANTNTNISETNFVSYTSKNASGDFTLSLDVSNYQGDYYIKLYCGQATAKVTIVGLE